MSKRSGVAPLKSAVTVRLRGALAKISQLSWMQRANQDQGVGKHLAVI